LSIRKSFEQLAILLDEARESLAELGVLPAAFDGLDEGSLDRFVEAQAAWARRR